MVTIKSNLQFYYILQIIDNTNMCANSTGTIKIAWLQRMKSGSSVWGEILLSGDGVGGLVGFVCIV